MHHEHLVRCETVAQLRDALEALPPRTDTAEALAACLERLPPPADAADALWLIAHLGAHHAPAPRLALVRWLRGVAASPALAVALAALVRRDPDPGVRRLAVAVATREHAAPATRAAALDALDDPDDAVARAAALSLCETLPDEALDARACDALVGYVAHRDPNQAGRVGRLLARAADPRALALLVDAVERGSHFWHHAGARPLERALTFEALGSLADHAEPEARTRLEAALVQGVRDDPYSYGREAAWLALARLGWSRADRERLYREAAPATHPPSHPRALASFDADAARDRLAATWAPLLDAEDARIRADARAIVRWIKRPALAERVREAADRVPDDERAALLELARLL